MNLLNQGYRVRRIGRGRRLGRGVTLMELMVVIIIIGLLAGLLAPEVVHYVGKAKVATAKAQIKHLHDAVRNYYLDIGAYPQSLQDLITEPSGATGWNKGGYLEGASEIPKDPWVHDYIYQCPGTKGPFDIISYGADGKEGGEGDNADIYNSDLGKSDTGPIKK